MRIAFCAAIVLLCAPARGTGQTIVTSSMNDSARAIVDTSGPGELKLLGNSIWHGITSPTRWSDADGRRLARAGALVVALSVLDDSGRDFMKRNESERTNDVADYVESMGTVENYAVLGGFLAAGIIFDDRKARATAIEGVASSAVAAGIITPTLQFLVGRARPREKRDPYTFEPFSGKLSFPSGHTTQAFAVASVIATEYDEPWVQATAFGGATLVGLARMYHGGHFISDVAAAALIGTAVGHSIARYGQRLRIQPVVTESGGTGIQFGVRTR